LKDYAAILEAVFTAGLLPRLNSWVLNDTVQW